eukprot:7388169-Prymnesium_polylepis.1
MSLSPPKFPSAKNLGLVVRQTSSAGVYADRDPEDATEGGNVDFTVAIGRLPWGESMPFIHAYKHNMRSDTCHQTSLLSSLTLTPALPCAALAGVRACERIEAVHAQRLLVEAGAGLHLEGLAERRVAGGAQA